MTPLCLDDLPISILKDRQHSSDSMKDDSAFVALYAPAVLMLQGLDSWRWCTKYPQNALSSIILGYASSLTHPQKRLLEVLQAWVVKRALDKQQWVNFSLYSLSAMMKDDPTHLGHCVRCYLIDEEHRRNLEKRFQKHGLLKTRYIELVLSSSFYYLQKNPLLLEMNQYVVIESVLGECSQYPLNEYMLEISEFIETGNCQK